MQIVINHLTRMKKGYICVAGVGSLHQHVRPVLPSGNLPTSLLNENGGPFGIASIVSLGSVSPRTQKPKIEDVMFDPNQASFINAMGTVQFWQLLSTLALPSLKSIFGEELEQPGIGKKSCFVRPGQGKASLGCLAVRGEPRLYIDEPAGKSPRVRLVFKDSSFDNERDFSVTDIRFFGDDHVTVDRAAVNKMNNR